MGAREYPGHPVDQNNSTPHHAHAPGQPPRLYDRHRHAVQRFGRTIYRFRARASGSIWANYNQVSKYVLCRAYALIRNSETMPPTRPSALDPWRSRRNYSVSSAFLFKSQNQ